MACGPDIFPANPKSSSPHRQGLHVPFYLFMYMYVHVYVAASVLHICITSVHGTVRFTCMSQLYTQYTNTQISVYVEKIQKIGISFLSLLTIHVPDCRLIIGVHDIASILSQLPR